MSQPKTLSKANSIRLAAALAGLMASHFAPTNSAAAATYTWTGNTTSSNWSENNNGTTNWQGNVIPISDAATQLLFSSSAHVLSPNQDIANPLNLNSITFGGSAFAFTVTGNAIQLSSNGTQMPQIVQNSTIVQAINNNLSLANDVTLSGTGTGQLQLGGTIDGAHALSANLTGSLGLGGAIGATTPLASLTVTAAAPTSILGSSVTTTGAQTYNVALSISDGGTTTFNSTSNGNITFAKSVEPTNSTGEVLDISTAGTTTFGGMVGGTYALTGVGVEGSGPIAINGGGVSSSGIQRYSGPVTLGADAAFSGASAIYFQSTVDGAYALTVTPLEEFHFEANVGAVTPLSSISVAGTYVSLPAIVKTTGAQTYNASVLAEADLTLTSTAAGNIDIPLGLSDDSHNVTVNTAGVTTFNDGVYAASVLTDAPGSTVLSGEISTTGSQTYNDSVTITGAGVNFLTSTGGANITFANTLDGGAALSLNTSGTITFGGIVGGITPLKSLTAGSSIVINGGAVTTTGVQTFSGPVTIGANTIFTSTSNSSIIFNSTIDGAFAVTISSGAQISFRAVGATTPLTSLSLSSPTISGSTVTAGSITQTAGTNKTTFSGLLHATSAGGISLTGNTFSLAAISIDQGPLAINNSGSATVSGTISGAGSLTKSGSGTLTLKTSSTYSGSTTVSAGAITLNSGASLASTNITVNAGSTFNVNGTLATNLNLTTSGATNLGPSASGILNRTLAALNITGGSVAVTAASTHTARTLLVSPLSFSGSMDTWQGKLDLTNNDMVVNTGNLTWLFNQLHEGFNNGTWAGQGITSSSALTAKNTAIGIELNDDGTGTQTPLVTSFDGQTTGDTDVLMKYTYFGDADLSGTVGASDYLLIDNGFNSGGTKTGWRNGDFNYDGHINGDDYTLIDNAFNSQGTTTYAATSAGPAEMIATDTAQIAASVPEPTGLALLGLAGLAARRRMRKGYSQRTASRL